MFRFCMFLSFVLSSNMPDDGPTMLGGQELHLSTGQLASAPLQLAASVAGNGQIVLTWLAPISDGYIPLTGYQARCGGPWEDLANTKFTHEMVFSPPAGLVTCEVRALNAVGEGAVAQTTLTLL